MYSMEPSMFFFWVPMEVSYPKSGNVTQNKRIEASVLYILYSFEKCFFFNFTLFL